MGSAGLWTKEQHYLVLGHVAWPQKLWNRYLNTVAATKTTTTVTTTAVMTILVMEKILEGRNGIDLVLVVSKRLVMALMTVAVTMTAMTTMMITRAQDEDDDVGS